MKKRRKKSPYKKLLKKCDEAFSKLVRSRGKCERCGRTQNLQCSHIIPRRNKSLRWEPLNALCLCAGCHKFFWHENPLNAIAWFKDNHREISNWLLWDAPQKHCWYFEKQARMLKKKKWGVEDLEKVLETIKKKLKE